MKFSEEQIKDIISFKESLIDQIDKHQEDIERLEKNLLILDLVLKESSFTRASDLTKKTPTKETAPIIKKRDERNLIPIKRGSSDEIIANAFVTPDQVAIILDESMEIDANTPPFKSLFID